MGAAIQTKCTIKHVGFQNLMMVQDFVIGQHLYKSNCESACCDFCNALACRYTRYKRSTPQAIAVVPFLRDCKERLEEPFPQAPKGPKEWPGARQAPRCPHSRPHLRAPKEGHNPFFALAGITASIIHIPSPHNVQEFATQST